jgi:hypothetical protein
MPIKLTISVKITFFTNGVIASNTTQARKDPNYINIYLFESEFFVPSNRFILIKASNKISKHMKSGIEGKVSDHLTFYARKAPLIVPNAK